MKIALSVLFIVIDQIVKLLVTSNIALYDKINIIPNTLDITHVQNTGAAFSILTDNTLLLIFITIIAIYLIYNYMLKEEENVIIIGLIFGGVISNLLDRVIRGYVVDYINFKAINFPVFNIADICIVVGFILYIIKILNKK